MNDNQRIFTAFFIILVAALQVPVTGLTGSAIKNTPSGIAIGDNTLPAAAFTYCKGKGDMNNDGQFNKEDVEAAQLIFTRGGDWLRNHYDTRLDVYPVRQPCGDNRLTQQDLRTLIAMNERKNDEFNGKYIQNRKRCSNECRIDQVALAPNGFRTCGNTDNDPCREWIAHQCPTGYQPQQRARDDVICIASRSREGESILQEQATPE